MNIPMVGVDIQSTAGAVPMRNAKGEISMQKVKVHRYVTGKRPQYAPSDSISEESDLEDFFDNRQRVSAVGAKTLQKNPAKSDAAIKGRNTAGDEIEGEEYHDRRLRRLYGRSTAQEDFEQERRERHRHIHEPEMVDSESADSDNEALVQNINKKFTFASLSDSDSELSDTELEKRRTKLRQKILIQQQEVEVLEKEDENQSEVSDTESSDYEEETESEDDNKPRLKPIFVRKHDRTTIQEKGREAQIQKQLKLEAKREAKERRRDALRLVAESVKRDNDKAKPNNFEANINDVCTDDENDEMGYEAWKLRELKRMRRDREERENGKKEKLEIERIRSLTEEERRDELRNNPKMITNKAFKGKYKFLQKYYHRGAFYLNEENDVLKRDFAQATLEDHFDKTILPKVMQVKNFGRCGRTKYTHLADQDTTKFDAPWTANTENNIKFHSEKAGGMKQVFDRPTMRKRRKMD